MNKITEMIEPATNEQILAWETETHVMPADYYAFIRSLIARITALSTELNSLENIYARECLRLEAAEAAVERWVAQAVREDDCREMQQVRAEVAEKSLEAAEKRIAELDLERKRLWDDKVRQEAERIKDTYARVVDTSWVKGETE